MALGPRLPFGMLSISHWVVKKIKRISRWRLIQHAHATVLIWKLRDVVSSRSLSGVSLETKPSLRAFRRLLFFDLLNINTYFYSIWEELGSLPTSSFGFFVATLADHVKIRSFLQVRSRIEFNWNKIQSKGCDEAQVISKQITIMHENILTSLYKRRCTYSCIGRGFIEWGDPTWLFS